MLKNLRRHIMMQATGGGGVLPDEYQQVQYLQSDGASWLAIPFNFGSNVIKLKVTSLIMPGWIFGSWANSQGNGINLDFTNDTNWRFWLGNVSSMINIKQVFNIDASSPFTLEYENNLLKCGENSISYTPQQLPSGLSVLPIFCCFIGANRNSYARLTTSAIYDEFIFETDAQSVRLIPCYRKSDNVAGVYDIVSNQFFTNAGSGSFIVGGDV